MSAIKVNDIVRATASVYGITTEELRYGQRRRLRKGEKRSRSSEARMVAAFVARRLTKASLRQIDERTGDPGATGTNTCYRVKTCAKRIQEDEALRDKVARVIAIAVANVTVIRERDLPARLARQREHHA